MTTSQAFDLALQHHQSGRLAEAEALYRQILTAQPNHADALRLLGVVAHQLGQHNLAVTFIRKAIAANPSAHHYHLDLGNAQMAQGHFDEAEAAFRATLQFKPDFAIAHNNLGAVLKQKAHLDDAIASYRRALQIDPDYATCHSNLSVALKEQGQFDEAVYASQCALRIKPDFPEAHNNLGNALKEQGRIDEAIAAYRSALRIRPDFPEAHGNLGKALYERGQIDEAIIAYRRAIELKPNYPEAYNNLGSALRYQGRLVDAISTFRRAIELNPNYAQALNNLASALRGQGRLDEAIDTYRRAIDLNCESPEAHNNLGNALWERGRLDEAIASHRRALALKPGYSEAHSNLGSALRDQGRLDEAIDLYRRALELNPDQAWAHSNLVYMLHFHPEHDARSIADEQQRWNRRFSDPVKPLILRHENERSPERRLRVGYVSPDFRDHVVGRYLLPLLQRHDQRAFDIICYAGVVQPDKTTECFQTLAPTWRSTIGVSDARLAEMIREDKVDILVDLSQHMAGNRLPTFARKPAPIQVSFAGYPESTGLETIEYRISDRFLEAGLKHDGTGRAEQVFLIDSFWCYEPDGTEPEVFGPPATESGSVTFGCLNSFSKFNEQTLRLWARVLGRVKDSRLILLSSAGSHQGRTLEVLEREGVEPHRVKFVEPRPRREYLELYRLLDVVLDTFPYNGHTTSIDALWMGAPVVSLTGETPVSRAGLSLLTNLGLPELVAHSESKYVNIAVSLARDLPRLAQLRSTLRHRMENSVLMDAPRFARNIEAAYRSMWKRWCSGKSPTRDGLAS